LQVPGDAGQCLYNSQQLANCTSAHVATNTCLMHLQVGAALEELLSEGVVTRDQLFITTKLWWVPLTAH
jgi:hypothetical protein